MQFWRAFWRKRRAAIPYTEMAMPTADDVVCRDNTRFVYKAHKEEIGTICITPDGQFIDRDGIIEGR